eukprot:scaffold45170_cov32-Tisochrysis_lutea.AAC.6
MPRKMNDPSLSSCVNDPSLVRAVTHEWLLTTWASCAQARFFLPCLVFGRAIARMPNLTHNSQHSALGTHCHCQPPTPTTG